MWTTRFSRMARPRAPLGPVYALSDETLVLRHHAREGRDPVLVLVVDAAGDVAVVGATEPNRAIDHRLQHGIEVERRPRDRLDDVVNRSLALLG